MNNNVIPSVNLPIWLTNHCQFGHHGEPFLWFGSGNEDVDIAIMNLINLAETSPKLALEASEFVFNCYAESKEGLRVQDYDK